ncbi:MAG: toprim domain-containing protein [Pseudomonadota bacterium]
MSNKNKDPDWDYINSELDKYYAPYITGGSSGSLLSDGFKLKKGGNWNTPSGAPLEDDSGRFFLFHTSGKYTGYPTLSEMASSGTLIKNYSPRLYVKEFGCYSGMGDRANVAMYKEVFTPEILEREFGWRNIISKPISQENKTKFDSFMHQADLSANKSQIVITKTINEDAYIPHENDLLLSELNKRGAGGKWDIANSLLNRYYSSVAYQFLVDNFLMGNANERQVEFYKPDGTGFSMYSDLSAGGFCISYNKTGEMFTPFTFMLKHSSFSEIKMDVALDDMFREAFSEDEYLSILSSVKKAPVPTSEQIKEYKESKKKIKLDYDAAIKKVQRMFGKGKPGDGGILQRRGISKDLLSKDSRFNRKLVCCTEAWSIGYLKKIGFDLGSKASALKDEKRVNISYVAFKHYNSKGVLVGGERFFRPDAKGKNLKLFTAAPSQKLLWMSDGIENSKAVFIFENVLDALSHAQLYPDKKDYGYMATCGRMGEHGMDYLKYQLNKLSHGRSEPIPVILAFDNDSNKKIDAAEAMRKHFIKELSPMYDTVDNYDNNNSKGLIGVVMPYGDVNDWNDSLRAYISRVELNQQNTAALDAAAKNTKQPPESVVKSTNDLSQI